MSLHIGIFGLGYVGLTTAACLLEKHFKVTGYEVSPQKRELLARGVCPLIEPGVEPKLLDALKEGRFTVRGEVDPSGSPDLTFICVGTPSAEDGAADLRAVNAVFQELDTLVAAHPVFRPEVILRSTVPPGTLGNLLVKFPRLFQTVPVLFYPEFLREGTAIKDFNQPPQTVVGRVAEGVPPEKILSLFAAFGFDYELVDAASAESLKFACNAFHALKVAFANEMGRLVSSCGGDAQQVMRLFCQDTQLNISDRYLRPGNPYGGSCLPKDTRSMANLSHRLGLSLDLVKACESSNRAHFDYIIRAIQKHNPKVITLLGFAFKKDTDDIRESPSLELLQRLVSLRSYTIRAHDFLVRPETALGVNERLMDKLMQVPDFRFHQNLQEAVEGADLVVVMHPDARYWQLKLSDFTLVIDVAEWKRL